MRGTIAGFALAALSLGLLPSSAEARPGPGEKSGGFRLFARSVGFINTNRVFYGLTTRGEIGTDSSGAGTTGGGYWPRGTNNEYMFNAGFQFAGIIGGSKPANPWGGDTTGAMLFDATGPRKHGAEVTPIYRGQDPADVAIWPEVGLVPEGDDSELLFDPLLRGQVNASQGDVYWITWDGDPAFISSRPHPLGLLVEHRGLAWNYPAGNEDILYFIITYYNVTSLNAADYAQHRPAMRDLLIEQAQKFHALNNARFGITLPTEGYTINELYAAFAADPDVGTAGANYSSVNLPFAMGYAYQRDFARLANWVFDPAIFSAPFFPGVGFVGVKYLKGPSGPGEIQLFSNTCNGVPGCPADPNGTTRLWRYLSGKLDLQQGDVVCGIPGDPAETHVCFVRNAAASDVRFFQSSTAQTLAPGEASSVVVAFVHAAPVLIPGFAPTSSTDVKPFTDSPLWISSVDSMSKYGGDVNGGVNTIDSIMGFLGYSDLPPSGNGDGIPQQAEFRVRPGSLLGKALVAQQVFDGKFLLPFSPEPPEFFLIPGDQQVTILWKPTISETTGDPFFAIAGSATLTTPDGIVNNNLYDPNYRRFDVEGYRLYRGRLDSPGSLKLIQQWDYTGTTFRDYGGLIVEGGNLAGTGNCAPELGKGGSANGCRANFTTITPGVTSTINFAYDLVGPIVQVNYGGRDLLANGNVIILPGQADSALTNQGFPQLANTGVPFVYVDRDVRNGVRYFYAVTAFDVNSARSAPTSLESAKASKSIVVGAPPANVVSTGNVVTSGPFGRGANAIVDATAPTIDPATGKFSKKAQPSNGLSIALGAFVTQVLQAGEVAVRLDSITLANFAAGANAPATNWFSIVAPSGTTTLSVPYSIGPTSTADVTTRGNFIALEADADLAEQYGGGGGYQIPGSFTMITNGGYYMGVKSRGCVNTSGGFSGSGTRACSYNGPRFFQGDNETLDNPNSANPANFNTGNVAPASYNNVGALPAGVVGIHRPTSYEYGPTTYREVEMALSPFMATTDTRIYWGAAGRIDSVIDLVHNTVVPFSTRIGATWGILNSNAPPATTAYDQRAVLTYTDIGCVAPFNTISAVQGQVPCTGGPTALSNTVVPGPIAYKFTSSAYTPARTAPVEANNGFLLYLRGQIYMVELAGGAVPAAGQQWTVRDYIGAIRGGNGAAGQFGVYAFTPVTRPFSAIGASMKFQFTVTNEVTTSTEATLANVHTVPDPYYVTSAYDRQVASKVINFVNVPTGARIRIYTTSGVLVRVLDAPADAQTGTVTWDVRNRSNQFVASGVYFYHVEADGATKIGRMTVVNFAQ
jgi:hypothetical protein